MASSNNLLFSTNDLLFFFKTPDNSRLFTQQEIELRISNIKFAEKFKDIELYKTTIRGKIPLTISKLDYPKKGLPKIEFIDENDEMIDYIIIDKSQPPPDIYFRSERDKNNFSSILNRIYQDIENQQSQIELEKQSLTVSWDDLGFEKHNKMNFTIKPIINKLLEDTNKTQNQKKSERTRLLDSIAERVFQSMGINDHNKKDYTTVVLQQHLFDNFVSIISSGLSLTPLGIGEKIYSLVRTESIKPGYYQITIRNGDGASKYILISGKKIEFVSPDEIFIEIQIKKDAETKESYITISFLNPYNFVKKKIYNDNIDKLQSQFEICVTGQNGDAEIITEIVSFDPASHNRNNNGQPQIIDEPRTCSSWVRGKCKSLTERFFTPRVHPGGGKRTRKQKYSARSRGIITLKNASAFRKQKKRGPSGPKCPKSRRKIERLTSFRNKR